MSPSIKPTKTERENGWDEQALARYIDERNQAAAHRILGDGKKPLQVETVKRFNPHYWMKGN